MSPFASCNKSDFKVRPLKFTDLSIVYQLLVELSPFKPDSESYRAVYEKVSRQENAAFLCAVDSEKVVGFASIFYLTRVRGGDLGLIEDVIVDGAYRRHGIGRMLLDALLAEAERKGVSKIILESSDMARPFYQSFGFELEGSLMKKILGRTS